MKRWIIFLAAMLALGGIAQATNLSGPIGCGGGGWITTDLTGPLFCTAAAPVVCVPGAPTGQMDFSVCSNIAITAAVF